MRRLLVLCGLFAFGLWALQVTPYLNPANDAGRYMVLGESLALSGDLRLLNDIRHPLDTLYPPGFPAIIAFWLKVTGRDPGGVVVPVKLTQIALLIGSLPLLYLLLKRARLPFPYIAAALFAAAFSPALIAYANEVMSEIPLLFLCLASVVLVESATLPLPSEARAAREGAGGWVNPPPINRVLSLLCAAAAFLVRSA
ncbi:MAG TPA: hypothetical protein VFB21_10780, partial [Chthonomonadaceae bacterium]|nr:hypothetical protein [Chthonomonadaceae bacterium]